MNERKNKYKKIVYSAIFNMLEILIIILFGKIMQVDFKEIAILMIMFFIARTTCYKPMHYKSPILCMIWSTAIFCSFFLLTKINLLIAIGLTIFEAILLTEKGNIADCFLYKNKEDEKKYRELISYVETHKNTEQLKRFEERLVEFNHKYDDRFKVNLYEIYKLIFLEKCSYKQVKKQMNLRDDNHIIINSLDMIFICFDTYIVSEEYYKKANSKELAKVG